MIEAYRIRIPPLNSSGQTGICILPEQRGSDAVCFINIRFFHIDPISIRSRDRSRFIRRIRHDPDRASRSRERAFPHTEKGTARQTKLLRKACSAKELFQFISKRVHPVTGNSCCSDPDQTLTGSPMPSGCGSCARYLWIAFASRIVMFPSPSVSATSSWKTEVVIDARWR